VDQDLGMMVFALGEVREPVDERDRLGEVADPKAALKRAPDLVPAFGIRRGLVPHRAAAIGILPRSLDLPELVDAYGVIVRGVRARD
jgi:hypothetical protein